MKKFFKKIKDWFKRHKPSKRRLIQLYSALLYNANFQGFKTGNIYTGGTKNFCVPGLNCYSCPGAAGACPLGALQNALASSGTRAPFYVFGIIILFGLLLGRTICGFLCPVGLVQELMYKIKTPKLKKSRVTKVLSYFKYVILAVLVIGVPLMYSLQSFPVPGFCKYICPAGTLGGAIGLLVNPNNADLFPMLGSLFTWKFAVLVVLLVASVFIFRVFCRFLCPLGALYGFFCRIAMLGVKLDKNKCTDCGLCIRTCKMDISRVGDHECIQCGECIAVCPAKAISWKGSKLFLHVNAVEEEQAEKPLNSLLSGAPQTNANDLQASDTATEKVSLGNLMAGDQAESAGMAETAANNALNAEYAENAAVGNNNIAQQAESAEIAKSAVNDGLNAEYAESAAEIIAGEVAAADINTAQNKIKKRNFWLQVGAWALALCFFGIAVWYLNFRGKDIVTGSEVGDLCPDYTLERYGDDGTFSVSANKGKITVINFWATWCTPCVAEIPYFEQLANNYRQIEVVAVHGVSYDDVQAFIDLKWSGYTMTFAQDIISSDGITSEFYAALGGKGTWPMTVILDTEGIITFSAQGKITYELLQQQIEKLL